MIKITLPDGSVREFAPERNSYGCCQKALVKDLARNVISASFNGTTVETETPLTTDGSLHYILGMTQMARKHSGIRLRT